MPWGSPQMYHLPSVWSKRRRTHLPGAGRIEILAALRKLRFGDVPAQSPLEEETPNMTNPLVELQQYGQSPWYDTISRGMITSGEIARLIEEDGLRGMTSNPAIFEKAIAGSRDYANALGQLAATGRSPIEIYEAIAIQDIQWTADVLSTVYESTEGRDGYISLEVSPHLAHDTQGTIDEALRLAAEVGRPNLMVKVPGTVAGLPAIEHLIGEGLNVNITLLFSVENYIEVSIAYMAGLERLASRGGNLGEVASVASFFVSRIDTMVDNLIEKRLGEVKSAAERLALRSLRGRVAIANAKLAYSHYRELVASERWQKLAAGGAQTQRLLWASTSTKDPDYRDVLYVEQLIGADTVNTMPEATLIAFRDHGLLAATLEDRVEEAEDVMSGLGELGISMKDVTDTLQKDAVSLFVEPFDKLLSTIEAQCEAVPRRA